MSCLLGESCYPSARLPRAPNENHMLKCPACGHITPAGNCFGKYNAGATLKIGHYCPRCSQPNIPKDKRFVMECIEDQLTEGHKLLLRG